MNLRVPNCITPVDLRCRPDLVQELRSDTGAHAERRIAPARIEARAGEGEAFTIEGHAAVFNELSGNLGGFRERIDRGAFRKVLRDDPDVYCLVNHDGNLILGRTLAGNLTCKEDGSGLAYVCDPSDTSVSRDARTWIESGEINQSSFAFRVADDSWEEDPETGGLIRTIHEFSALYDVSPCVYPAYPQTDVGLRSAIEKLSRGEVLTTEERAEVQTLLEASTDEERSEQVTPADGQERDDEADVSSRSDVEDPETLDGISPVAARLRINELIART